MPELIWSGVVGALIALASNLLTNWGNNRRQRQQLDHDLAQRKTQLTHDEEMQRIQLAHESEERRIEREMTLRRDVYLAATEAVGNLQEYIANSARTDVPEAERLKLAKGSSGVLNKIHMVGTIGTIRSFSNVQLTFARGTFRLEEQRLAILKMNFRIEDLKRELDNLQRERQDLPDEGSALIEKFHSLSRAIEDKFDELDGAQRQLLELQLELARKAAEAHLEIQEALEAAVLAGRAELRLPIDAEEYQSSMSEHRRLLRVELNGFIERVRGEAAAE